MQDIATRDLAPPPLRRRWTNSMAVLALIGMSTSVASLSLLTPDTASAGPCMTCPGGGPAKPTAGSAVPPTRPPSGSDTGQSTSALDRARRVSVGAELLIHDKDAAWIGEHDDERIVVQNAENLVGPTFPVDMLEMSESVDDEVRAELYVTATAISDGDVRLDVKLVVFEGSTDKSTKEVGRQQFALVVPRDQQVTKTPETAGNNYARVTLTAWNNPG